MSIRARLLWLALALTLPLTAIAAGGFLHAYRSERKATEALLQDTTRALSLAVDGEVGQARTVLTLVAQATSLRQGDLAAFHERARRAVEGTVEWMWLARPDGEVLLSTRFPPGTPLPPSSRTDAYRRMETTRRPELSGLIVGKATNQRLLALEMPVFQDDRLAYVLGISVPAETLQKLTTDLGLPGSWVATILDHDGLIVGRSRDPERFAGTRAPEDFLGAIARTARGSITLPGIDGVPVLATFDRSPGYGLVAAVGYPTAEFADTIRRSLWWLGALGVAAACGLVAAIMLARGTATSIARLHGAARELGRGDEPQLVRTGLREVDEVGQAITTADRSRRDLERQGRERDIRLRLALDAGRLGEWELDPAAMALTASPACKAGFGRGPGDPLSYGDLVASIHPEDRDRWERAVADAIATRAPVEIACQVIWPDGSLNWVHLQGGLIERDGAGLLVGVSQDVTRRKRAEEQQSLLLHELNHRVKNTLATVQSMAVMTFRSAPDLDTASDAFQGRIMGMAKTHDLLTESQWEGAALRSLLEGELGPYQDPVRRRVNLRGPDVRLGPAAVLALGLAVHELATNAAKYGALSTETGRLSVRWASVRVEGLPHLLVEWDESGGPPVTPPTRRGFGSRLLERALAHDLNGKIKLHYAPTGLRCVITFPLHRVVQERAEDGPAEAAVDLIREEPGPAAAKLQEPGRA